MKILVGIAITIFVAFTSYVFVGGYIEKNQVEAGNNTNQSQPARKQSSPKKEFTSGEVSKHDTYDDCWLIINNSVYDVTDFLGQHPGGAGEIIPHCGKESTQAFATQDRGPGSSHSTQATDMLSAYLIGKIK